MARRRSAPLAVSHTCTLHHELDQYYWQPARGADGMDRWIFSSFVVGAGLGGGAPMDFSLSLPGALSTGDLTIRMYGPFEMAHETAVSLNGSSIGSATWSGIILDGGGLCRGEPVGWCQHGLLAL